MPIFIHTSLSHPPPTPLPPANFIYITLFTLASNPEVKPEVKPEATPEAPDQSRDIKEGAGEDKFPGGAKGRGRGTQAAAPGGKLSEELVEQMKQSLGISIAYSYSVKSQLHASQLPPDLNKAEPQLSTCSAKQTEPQQQQPCKSRSTGGTLPQDTHAASTTFNPNAPPFVPSSKYDPTSHASARSDVAQKHSQFEPTQATPTTTSLNVNAKAFVPSFAKAGGVGAEQVMREEDTQQYEDVLEEGLVLLDDIVDPYTIPGIMAEFEGGLDEQGVALLKTGAEILVTCTQYPATFERLQHKLRKLVEACFVGSPPAAPSPAQLALSKLCEMIVLWVWKTCVFVKPFYNLSPSPTPFFLWSFPNIIFSIFLFVVHTNLCS